MGNPVLDSIRFSEASDQELRSRNDLDPNLPIISLFPGSRTAEVMRNSELIMKCVEILSNRLPLQFIIAASPAVKVEAYNNFTGVKLWRGSVFDLMRVSKFGILKSGTSNLQAAIVGMPFVMFYQISPISAFFLRQLIKIKQYSGANLIRPNTVREFVNSQADPAQISEAVLNYLTEEKNLDRLKESLQDIRKTLENVPTERFPNSGTVAERTAILIIEMFKQESHNGPQ